MKRLLMIRMIKIGVVCFISQLILLGNVLAQDRRYVHSDTANIRMKPDVKSEKLWEVEKYHPFIVLETKGKWCRI